MPLELSHAEALRLARLSGELIRSVYGRPSVVVGVARSGTELAAQLSTGADSAASVRVHQSRPSSSGGGAVARRIWVAITPEGVRRTYKNLLFRPMSRLSSIVESAPSCSAGLAELDEVLSPDDQLVVIVDDSIDSGRTARSMVEAVEQRSPRARIVVFAIGSPLRRTVTTHQLTLWAGSVVHLIDGDLAELDDPDRIGPGSREADEPDPATDPPSAGSDTGCTSGAARRRLYLDLDGTITPDSFRDAARLLMLHLVAARRWPAVLRFAAIRVAKKGRMVRHGHLKQALDREIRALLPDERRAFDRALADRLRTARPALLAVGHAPGVRCSIVTAALAAYVPAIESAFDLPVLGGSGPDPHGQWVEIGSEEKLAAIRDDRGDSPDPALLVGDTLTDGLTATSDLTVVSVPSWDQTGLLTILGVPTWWAGAAR